MKCRECGLSDYMHNGRAAGWCTWEPERPMTDVSSGDLYRIKREQGVKAAKEYAARYGYSVRWDREGSVYIRDLIAE